MITFLIMKSSGLGRDNPWVIAYIASDGRIVEIHDMEPGNLNPVHSSRSVRYALEVPQGWFNRAGLGPGDRLDTQGL